MTNKTINIVLITICVFLLGIGFWIGRSSKSYKTNVSIKTDTVLVYDTIISKEVVEKPTTVFINKEIIKERGKLVYIDTSSNTQIEIDSNEALFTVLDTLKYNTIGVSILDSANCYGILSRRYKFFGEIESKVITNTITNTITPKIPLYSLYGGLFYNMKDIGPSGSIILKNRVNVGYSFGIINKSHNFTALYKIK